MCACDCVYTSQDTDQIFVLVEVSHTRLSSRLQEQYTLMAYILKGSMMVRGWRCLDDRTPGMMLLLVIIFSSLLTVLLVLELFHGETIVVSQTVAIKRLAFSKENNTLSARKLLQSTDYGDANRIGTTCSRDDIAIYQGSASPLPSGIPSYNVQILNVCVSGCSMSNIHVSCGWFSSARLINPTVFRRVEYDDCLVNDGEALGPAEILSFQYANSFPYQLSVTSVTCC